MLTVSRAATRCIRQACFIASNQEQLSEPKFMMATLTLTLTGADEPHHHSSVFYWCHILTLRVAGQICQSCEVAAFATAVSVVGRC
ncbi:hypothetical protein NDU88_002888 [Pleurodeles waltl]|uniref:Uncharacterized protein n=1 Tax=Pleurodeles waltl TaxID=8319 RepID=A0AAV7V0Y7_PLEWA|nr:hypothetical protein NDU88_002888 [Pleurodeles waltl]